MSWTTPADLKAQLARLWDRGDLLRPLVTAEAGFPRRLTLKGPSSTELSDRFEAVRAWAAELAGVPHLRIEWREVRHRIQGRQRLPAEVWVDCLDEACALLSRRREAARLIEMLEMTRGAAPALVPWLAKRPLQAIALTQDWPRLLAIVGWLGHHPRPGIYLRQVDVPGVDTKFIERYRDVLSELLDLALPRGAIAAEQAGIAGFAARYGFLDKPLRVRFRVLDERIALVPGAALPDVALDARSFSALRLPVRRVFVTENETNFLAFPSAAESLVVFGAGYGWDGLATAQWLTGCELHYWGDIDTHGFAILDQLRSRFEHVASFLMDHDTLMAHEMHWGEEVDQVVRDLPRLVGDERPLYDDLRDNRIRSNLRLEQEKVGFERVTGAVRRLMGRAD